MAAGATRPVRSRSTSRIIGFSVGTQFWYGTTLVQIARVAGPDKLLVRHFATQRLEHLNSSELRAVEPDFDEGTQPIPLAVEAYSDAMWERARVVEEQVKKLQAQRKPSKRAEVRAAQQFGVSARHLRPVETARVLTEKRIPVRGSLQTTGALSVVQIDHTLADVILVDPFERRPTGRGWLTLALNVETRTV